MKRLFRLWRTYSWFSAAVLAAIVGLVLELTNQHRIAHWLLAVVSLVELIPLIWNTWQAFRSGHYGSHILAITAVITAIVLGQFGTGLAIVLIVTGSAILKNLAERAVKPELDLLQASVPKHTQVIRKGKILEVATKELKAGDKFIVKAGAFVPVDSMIIEGASSFDESLLSGQGRPLSKQAGQPLLGGTLNLDEEVTAKATHHLEDSQYQHIIKLLRSGTNGQAPLVKLAQAYSLPFIFLTYSIALAAWALSGHADRFLTVMAVATPAPFVLGPSIVLIGGVSRASRYGIVAKTGLAWERLARGKSIILNKTGVLTSGQLTLDAVKVFNKFSQTEVLQLAAGLAQNSNHAAAKAIVEGPKAQSLKLAKTKHVQEATGLGISASLRAQPVLIGRLSFIEDEGIILPAKFKPDTIKQTAVYVAVDGRLAGVITLNDGLRPETAAVVSSLRRQGAAQIILFTGDHQAGAAAVAKDLGINFQAAMLPADKIHQVEKPQPRPLIFVSNNVNDAPVLTAADVGIVLGALGSTGAGEIADILILPNDLSRLSLAAYLAKRSLKIARQGILAASLLSLILMLLFAAVQLPPLAAAGSQAVIGGLVILNALRVRLFTVND